MLKNKKFIASGIAWHNVTAVEGNLTVGEPGSNTGRSNVWLFAENCQKMHVYVNLQANQKGLLKCADLVHPVNFIGMHGIWSIVY